MFPIPLGKYQGLQLLTCTVSFYFYKRNQKQKPQTIFQSSSIILRPIKKCVKISIASHPSQYSWLSDFDCFTECVFHCCFNFYIPDAIWYIFCVPTYWSVFYFNSQVFYCYKVFTYLNNSPLYVYLLKIFSSNLCLASCPFQLLTLFSIGQKFVILIKISLIFFTWTVTLLCLLVYFVVVVVFTAQLKFPLPSLFQVLPFPPFLPTIHSSTVSLQISVSHGVSSCCKPRGLLLSRLDEAIW